MKKLILLVTLISAMLLISSLGFADTVTIGSNQSTNAYLPVAKKTYSYSQQIYPQSAINLKGQITKIRFYKYFTETSTPTWTIYLGHTDKTSFTNTNDWISTLALTCYSVSVNLGSAEGWVEITLPTPFIYNNTQNLVIGVYKNTGLTTGNPRWGSYTSTVNVSIYRDDNRSFTPSDPGTGKLSTGRNYIQLEIIPLPGAPTLIYPDDDATDISVKPTLTWNAPTTGGTPTGYKLYLGDSEDPSLHQDNITSTSYTITSPLAYNTTYHWTVSAYNAGGEGPKATVRSFTTVPAPPGQPTLSIPEDNTMDISLTPTLTWNAPTSGGTPTGYNLYLSTDSDPALYDSGTITETSYTLTTALQYNTEYYWTVSAYNAGGEGLKATEGSFTTLKEPPLPVELTSFFATISNQNKVNLNWVSQTETDLIGYYVMRGTDNDLSNARVISPLINATNTSQPKAYMYTDNELNMSGTYYYWLQYNNMDGTIGFNGPIEVKYEVNSGSSGDIPLVTSLDNVYPNPFNPIAYIPYTLESKSEVKINIYNTRGQVVKTFDLGSQEKGHHRITWDGRDNDGNLSGNGIYYIIMKAGKESFQRKAVLMK
jgi:hypothetical protein